MPLPMIPASLLIPGDIVIVTGRPATVTHTDTEDGMVLIYTVGYSDDPVEVRPTWPLAYTHLAPRPATA